MPPARSTGRRGCASPTTSTRCTRCSGAVRRDAPTTVGSRSAGSTSATCWRSTTRRRTSSTRRTFVHGRRRSATRSRTTTSSTPARRSSARPSPAGSQEEGLNLDVCSAGELTVALRAGRRPGRIGYHGNNKTYPELRRAVHAGVGRIVVDSFHEIERLAEIVGERGPDRQSVMIRVTAGVEAHTHEYIATAHEDQKFGFSITNGDAWRAVEQVLGRRRARPARPALPHREPDLRHLRLRGRGPTGARAARPHQRGARRHAARDGPRWRLRHRVHDPGRPDATPRSWPPR